MKPVSRTLLTASLLSLLPPPPRSTLFPYTTLFRSDRAGGQARRPPRRLHRGRLEGFRLQDERGRTDCQYRLRRVAALHRPLREGDRKSTRLNSSHVKISYAVFCLKKKTGKHMPRQM